VTRGPGERPEPADAGPAVLVAVEDSIATVTLNRPRARNALSRAVMHGLWDAVAAAGDDPGVAAVILTGADPAFCAGIDLKEVAGDAPPAVPPRDPGLGPGRDTNGLFRFLPVIGKPVIGAVNGVAVTGGLEVALQCTFLVASQRARFADTHARLGVMPGGGITVLMAQSMGLRRAIELSLTGNFLTPTRRSGSGWSTTSCRTRSCCRSPGGWPATSRETTRTPSAACSSTTARSPARRRSTRRTSSRDTWPRPGGRG
jgi:1,4-dihydroxy-2-naphthoyl-CoA synthase